MDVLVAAVLEAELEAGGADVACGVEVGRDERGGSDEHKAADVELPSVEEEGRDVLLHNEGALGVLQPFLLDVLPHLLSPLANLNAAPSVRVLAWLHDPEQPVPAVLGLALLVLHEIFVFSLAVVPDVEGKRHVVEDIVLLVVAELLHVVEQVLLVGQQAVVLDVVVRQLYGLPPLLPALPQERLQVLLETIPLALGSDQVLVLFAEDALELFAE